MLPRHNLVWPAAAGWDRFQAGTAAEATGVRDAVARWRAADWPLVACRAAADQPVQQMLLGMPLPPAADSHLKVRLAVAIDREQIRRHDAALTLACVLPAAPAHWRTTLLALQMAASETLPPLQVFGSLAMQSLTGMAYLHPDSDIDLLFHPQTPTQLDAGIALLDSFSRALPLDGEVVFADGRAVAWREWRDVMQAGGDQSAARVLTKSADAVALVACQDLLATLGPHR
jgi:phosphoribosyl-dephospho-CoA transferase